MPTTVKQLRDALGGLRPEFDDVEVEIWLPGSRITLDSPKGPAKPFCHKGKILLEGNVTPGSALAKL